MDKLLTKLQAAFPELTFAEGPAFSWSPSNHTVCYKHKKGDIGCWSLLHEVAHAQLDHRRYNTDFELLLLEVAAWDEAKRLADQYGMHIDEEHIQDCIDTYRDWLYQRSNCPTCCSTSLQENAVTYRCFNCGAKWTVTASRFCRPYRLTTKQKTPPEAQALQTTFL